MSLKLISLSIKISQKWALKVKDIIHYNGNMDDDLLVCDFEVSINLSLYFTESGTVDRNAAIALNATSEACGLDVKGFNIFVDHRVISAS